MKTFTFICIHSTWRRHYLRCWDSDLDVEDRSDWKSHFLHTVSHWLINRLVLTYNTCFSTICKHNPVIAAIFGFWPYKENIETTIYGVVVECIKCKLALPRYWLDTINSTQSISPQTVTSILELLSNEFCYFPTHVELIVDRPVMNVYLTMTNNDIDILKAFLSRTESLVFKCLQADRDHFDFYYNDLPSMFMKAVLSSLSTKDKLKVSIVDRCGDYGENVKMIIRETCQHVDAFMEKITIS